jgi:hypothetical protein
MIRRIRYTRVDSLEGVAALLATQPSPLVLIFDADNTVVRQGASPDEFATRVAEAFDKFEQLETVGRVLVISNGPQRGAKRMVSRVNKPWTTRKRLGIARRSTMPIWVIGDQVVSDGLLAWRLGAEFLHCAIDPDDSFPGQAGQRRLGRIIAPLILRRNPLSGPRLGSRRRPR